MEEICNQQIALASSVQRGMGKNLEEDLKKFSKSNYAVITNSARKITNIIFRPGSKSEDFLEAFALVFFAALLESGNSVKNVILK